MCVCTTVVIETSLGVVLDEGQDLMKKFALTTKFAS